MLAIEDGAQFKVELSSKEAHLLAASFAHYLLKNIGVSEVCDTLKLIAHF